MSSKDAVVRRTAGAVIVAALALAAPSVAQGAFDVTPTIDCQEDRVLPDGTEVERTAWFGYTNPNDDTVTVAHGPENIILQPPNFRTGQPTQFLPGRHARAFSTKYNPDDQPEIVWVLQGATATSRSDDSIPDCSAPALPVATRAPELSGTAMAGQTLALDPGEWEGSPDLSRQWQRCVLVCIDVIGETGPSYALGAADVGVTVRAVVSAENDSGTASQVTTQTHRVVSGQTLVPAAGEDGLLDFGSARLGTSVLRRVAVVGPAPDGAEILDLGRAGIDARDFIIQSSCAPKALQPGEACLADVRFTPSSAGPRSAELRVTTTEGSAPRTLELTGTGVQAGAAEAMPATLSFQTATGTLSPRQAVTLTNTGPVAFHRVGLSVRGSDGSQFQRGGCAPTVELASGASCTIKVRYAPTGAGTHVAALRITTSGTDPVTVHLSGSTGSTG